MVALLAALLLAAPASAASFGDVDVTIESEPKGTSTHGYAEVWVRVANRSAQATREVRLTLPKSSYSPGSDYLRAVTRTVTVEPGKTVRVALSYPERLQIVGTGLGVTIDGSAQTDAVPITSGFSSSRSGLYGTTKVGLVLYSRGVDTRFPDWMNAWRFLGAAMPPGLPGGWPGAAPGAPGAPPTFPTTRGPVAVTPAPAVASAEVEFVRAEQPVAGWSPTWLGYSRYDGVVVTADDLKAMPAEVRAAVGQYVECGGALLVLGQGGPLPGNWKAAGPKAGPFTAYAAGFGECLVSADTDLSDWDPDQLQPVLSAWRQTLAPWNAARSPADANRAFPVVDDIGVPVQGLLALMVVFAVAIGPVNLFVLGRLKRKLWLFWTVPLVSLVTCLGVFGYMAATEGWAGKARVEGVTILDETTRRASSLGWAGFYTPVLPGGGLHFSSDTEVSYQNGDDSGGYGYRRRRSGASALTLDWGGDQHLASGWLVPRVPAHFVVRKGEPRRERVTITAGADGRPEAVNGLGADLTDLWYADAAGNLFRAQNVPAGGKAALDPAPPRTATRAFRSLYAGDWSRAVDTAAREGPAFLTPRTYLAVMDAAPFLDDGLARASVRRHRSAVFGILREGGDEN